MLGTVPVPSDALWLCSYVCCVQVNTGTNASDMTMGHLFLPQQYANKPQSLMTLPSCRWRLTITTSEHTPGRKMLAETQLPLLGQPEVEVVVAAQAKKTWDWVCSSGMGMGYLHLAQAVLARVQDLILCKTQLT